MATFHAASMLRGPGLPGFAALAFPDDPKSGGFLDGGVGVVLSVDAIGGTGFSLKHIPGLVMTNIAMGFRWP